MKNLKTFISALQILRFAQNDKLYDNFIGVLEYHNRSIGVFFRENN